MRIAVVHSFYASDQPSGENVTVEAQADALREAGHHVHLIGRRTDDLVGGRGYRARSAASVATGIGPSPSQELTALNPDVVHVHNTFPNFGTRWLQQWGGRTVVTLHNYRTLCAAGTLFRDGEDCTDCLRRPAVPAIRHGCYRGSRLQTVPLAIGSLRIGGLHPLLSQPARLIALSSAMARTFGEATGRTIDVVPNFVPRATAGAIAPNGWAYVGRLTADKGIRELLAAWPAEEQLTVYGDGPLHAELVAAPPRTGVTFRGATPHEQLLSELGSYEGLIVPSLWREGLPTVIIEALAQGVPLLVSDRVAAGADLVAGGAALTFSITGASIDDLSTGLEKLRAEGLSMRSRCLALYEQKFTSEAWVTAVEKVYGEVAGPHD